MIRPAPAVANGEIEQLRLRSEDLDHGRLVIFPRNILQAGPRVMHEMVHALGALHACGWTSVMRWTDCPPETSSTTPTPADVAHLQLLLASSKRWTASVTRSCPRCSANA